MAVSVVTSAVHERREPLAVGQGSSYNSLMQPDDIIAALKAPGAVPAEALTAAVGQADALAPVIYAIADKKCRGVYLLPGDESLLFYGLHALAAVRHPGLLERLLALARLPGDDLDGVFLANAGTCLTRLLLSVWDRPASELFGLIEHADLAPEAKGALYDMLGRLTFDGRIEQSETVAFLARIERDNLIDDGDMTWWGWERAVVRLGLADFEPALRRVWSKEIYVHHEDEERDQALADLQQAAADPTNPARFDDANVRPVTDAVEAAVWVSDRARELAEWAIKAFALAGDGPATTAQQGDGAAEAEDEAEADDDPGAADRLTELEKTWLTGFLVSRQVPATTMPFEMLDGFLTALVIGPELVLPSEYLPIIWGTDDGEGPEWDGRAQLDYFMTLLTRHSNAIAARRTAHALQLPHIELFSEAQPGEAWADGFFTGIDLRADAWQPIFDDRRADQMVLPIIALSSEVPAEISNEMTGEMREATLDQLPVALQMIAAWWQSPSRSGVRREPARSAKVGRNEPCPCGSGKKYKKCCGASGDSSLH